MPIPATRHAIASAAIQTRSFFRIVRSCSVVLFLETSNIIHTTFSKIGARRKGLEYSERVGCEQKKTVRQDFRMSQDLQKRILFIPRHPEILSNKSSVFTAATTL